LIGQYTSGVAPDLTARGVYIPRRRPAPTRHSSSSPISLAALSGQPFISRFATHGLILSVALGAAFLTGNTFPILPAQTASVVGLPAWPQVARSSDPVDTERQHLQKAPIPITQSSPTTADAVEADAKTRTYLVQQGDTVYGLAEKFGVTAQTLIWANNLQNVDRLALDMELRIPPTSGVLHTVGDGDTLTAIAQRYQAAPEEILTYKANELKNPDALVLGMEIMVPGGVKPVEAPLRLASAQTTRSSAVANPPAPALEAPPAATGSMMWPTYGPIYSYFSAWHRGLDISPSYGTPVVAADGGVVRSAQYLRYGYGFHVIVDHGNGYSTMYAHLAEILVSPGQRVGRGELVGRVGVTGYATGPHLHFEVYQGGVPVNPLNLLPR
jgi:murein DD-endopeptidase MepM/ murein hydrolase activator NlpD